MADVYCGWDEVLSFYQDLLETFEITLEPDRFIEAGGSVIVPNTGRMGGRGGIETVARSAFVFDVRDGRISRIRLYQETREALEAVGLSE